LFASTSFDIDTRSLADQEQLVASFNATMSLCLEDANMTIPRAYHIQLRKTVLADISTKASVSVLSTIGVRTLRVLDIPLETWTTAGYSLTMLAEIGYEQEDFRKWDNQSPFSVQKIRQLEDIGIRLPKQIGGDESDISE
jgi:hypothetical protein